MTEKDYGYSDHSDKNRQDPPTSPLIKGGAGGGGIKPVFDAETLRKRGLIWNGRHLPYNPALIEKAKLLRKNPTPAEKKLWFLLLRNFPCRMLRQRPIDHFIVLSIHWQ